MPRPALAINEAQSSGEAIGFMLSGLWFFLQNHTMKTALALLILCGSSLSTVGMSYMYMKSDSITIQRATPVKPVAVLNDWSLFPQALAYDGGRGDSIILNGYFYGYNDPHFHLYKLRNQNSILIYDVEHGEVLQTYSPIFDTNIMEQKAQGK